MNEQRAREILAGFVGDGPKVDMCKGDGSRDVCYANWQPDRGTGDITLDGRFSADELEAFAWWMRHHAGDMGNDGAMIIITPDGMYNAYGQLLAKARKYTAAERRAVADYFASTIDDSIIEKIIAEAAPQPAPAPSRSPSD